MANFNNDPNQVNKITILSEPDSLKITAIALGAYGPTTAKETDIGGVDMKLTCGQTIIILTGKAEAIYKNKEGNEKIVDVSDKISWNWNGKPQATGQLVNDQSKLSKLVDQFKNSTNPVKLKARIEIGNKRADASFRLIVKCDLSSINSKSSDILFLTRAVYAEAGNLSEDEQATVAWTIVNRKNTIAKYASTKGDFGKEATIQSVITHVSKTSIQYQSYWDGQKKKNAPWNHLDRPEDMSCGGCARMKTSARIAEQVLTGKILDPYASKGGAFFMHLNVDGVIKGKQKNSIAALDKLPGFTHYFWTFDTSGLK